MTGGDDRVRDPFRVLEPEALGPARGFSHGMLAPAGGRVLFVAGQTAPRAEGSEAAADFADQFEGALRRVLHVVAEAGGRPAHVGSMTVYVTDLEAYRAARPELGRRWRELMGRRYPAMSLVAVDGLVDDDALVEIEAMAVLPEEPNPEEADR